MDTVLAYWFDIISSIVLSFFDYALATGVSYGWFLVACCIMAIVARFTFSKIIK